MQCGAILLSLSFIRGIQQDCRAGKVPVATRMGDVRFKPMVRPGETLFMEVELTEGLADAFFLEGESHGRREICRAVRVCLHGSRIDTGPICRLRWNQTWVESC